MLTLAWVTFRSTGGRALLTSFLATCGVVFLNLEVLKRFMLLSLCLFQIDFRAFRVSRSSWLAAWLGSPAIQLTVQVGPANGVRSIYSTEESGEGDYRCVEHLFVQLSGALRGIPYFKAFASHFGGDHNTHFSNKYSLLYSD